jgi:hypothetical protein
MLRASFSVMLLSCAACATTAQTTTQTTQTTADERPCRDDVKLQLQSEACRDDDATVRAAVALDGRQLQHASARLRADRTIVYVAIEQNTYALRFVDAALLTDGASWRGLVAMNPALLQRAPIELLNDDAFLHDTLRKLAPRAGPSILKTFPWTLVAERADILAIVVEHWPRHVLSLRPDLRTREVQRAAVMAAPELLPELGTDVANDAAFVAEVAARNGRVLLYASDAVQHNADIVNAADAGWQTQCADTPDLAVCTEPLRRAATTMLHTPSSATTTTTATATLGPCANAAVSVDAAACVEANLGRGVVLLERPTFVHLKSEGGTLHMTAGTFAADGVHVSRSVVVSDPFLRGLVAMQPGGAVHLLPGDPTDGC